MPKFPRSTRAVLTNLHPNPDSAEGKIAAFQQAKFPLADRPSQIPGWVKRSLWATQH